MKQAHPEPRPDGRQSAAAAAVQRGVARLLRATGFAVLTEFTLRTGRRADVIGMDAAGTIWIVEIKSSLADYRADQKWPEYWDYCDRLFFAVPPELDASIIPQEAGLIVADSWGADIIRQPEPVPLHASRRRALTLAFARTAALRLHGLYDPPVE